MIKEDISTKLDALLRNITTQFENRTIFDFKKRGVDKKASILCEVNDCTLTITINDGNNHSINVPIPYYERGIYFIKRNEVVRALCPFMLKQSGKMLSYMDVLYYVLCDNPGALIQSSMLKKTPFMQQIAYGIINDNLSITVHKLQKIINELMIQMPLHETDMNSWAMNQRVIIVDADFDILSDPQQKLAYQINKARACFNLGWTQIGLPDGTLIDKNYILTKDLKNYTPFGNQFHNPARNLYSTLGMRGDETPLIRTRSLQNLMDLGITRKGWNLFTVFADIPDVWEDQIMVDISHKDKVVEYETKYNVYGKLMVKEGDLLTKGTKLCEALDGQFEVFTDIADKAIVHKVSKTKMNVGGVIENCHIIVIKMYRTLKDGVKITNMSANKGVIRLKELGYAVDPRTGNNRKIDVIVSAKAVEKRKNFGQLLEALANNICDESVVVVEDDNDHITMATIKDRLVEKGFPASGTWHCHTYAGELDAIAGTVFWGVIHSVEDMIWENKVTTKINGRELRTAGLKFSTVEFRALETRFGKDNPIIEEILTYAQGMDDVDDYLKVIKCKKGLYPENCSTIRVDRVKAVDQTKSTIVPRELLLNTVADELWMPSGFIMLLPITYQTIIGKDGNVIYEGKPVDPNYVQEEINQIYTFDRVYVPSGLLRKSWRHGSGKMGLSEIANFVNNIVVLSNRYLADTADDVGQNLLYNAIGSYINGVTRLLSTKNGDIASYCMAIRYPSSAKAVATLSNRLPKNTIEIHTSMAKQLGVVNGDVVLVERFPCLGFMSLRPQKVKVTNDILCKYTIRVAGNSLGSTGLDFDGDVIYIASFHSEEATHALRSEWQNPSKTCYEVIKKYNNQKGAPIFKNSVILDDYTVEPFAKRTVDEHCGTVEELAGVKAYTGPVIAFLYNLMRVIENSVVKNNKKTLVGLEEFFTIVGEAVFDLKHGQQSPHAIFIDAICTGDITTLVNNGFDRSTATIICNTVRTKALEVGVSDLVSYHNNAKMKGSSTIINRIVRTQNRIYYASRSNLETCALLESLESKVVDVPSKIFSILMSGKYKGVKTALDIKMDKEKVEIFADDTYKNIALGLMGAIDSLVVNKPSKEDRKKPKVELTMFDNMFRRI